MGRRIRWLGVVMLLCFALVVVQLVNIQYRKASALADSPYNPRVASEKYNNLRGTIYASDGTILAQSVKSTSGSYHYMRVYPQGPLYAGITGYSSLEYGTSGIEYEYNQYLQTHQEAPQNFSQLLFNKPPSEPDDITLTVDPVLQQAAYTALTTLPPGPNKDGAVVVLNPTTGAVLAMVSNPTYDPNGLANPNVTAEEQSDFVDSVKDHEGFSPLTPIATEERFPPGSTFKVVTSTAVYNLKPSLINYSFPEASSISFTDSNKILVNDGGGACGGTMALMLPQSCDPGYGMLGEEVGVPTLTQEAQDFGYAIYGANSQFVPNIDLPDVIPSTFSQLLPDAQADLAYSAIGQYNDAATALQNALVAAGIANGGVIMTPHLMQQIRDSQGNVVKTYHPTPMLTAASQSAAASVNALMQTVANDTVPGATANGIFPPSWDVAVKTGTAQIQAPREPEQTDDWMIGFMPAKGVPKLAIAVVVPYQAYSATGAAVSGPIVRAVFQAYLNETGAPG
ncbi:MAG: penicillin-binding transpeptidase domain-containing protein [Acidimicrobiales bacterium]